MIKYEILKLDGRYTYRDWFQYCIKFSNRMAVDQGPLQFNQVMEWFQQTYGWSAEIRQYDKIMQWTSNTYINTLLNQRRANGTSMDRPQHCNPHWSWTNGYDDLRIYVKSEKELEFFLLVMPNDQK